MTNSSAAEQGTSNSEWRRRCRLTLKELRETLRDRRTILTLILMPVLAYPILGVAFQRLLISQVSGNTRPEYHVAFASPLDASEFDAFFSQAQTLYRLRERIRIRSDEADANSTTAAATDPGSNVSMSQGAETSAGEVEPILRATWPAPDEAPLTVEEMVLRGMADVGVIVEERPRFNRDEERGGRIQLFYAKGSPRSRDAYRYMVDRIETLNADWLLRVALEEHRTTSVTKIQVTPLSTATGRNVTLASLIPLVLLLMTVTGAVYPAIDLTAGERERHTLETLIAAPVPRLELLSAKYVAVVAVAILTAVINLASMIVTLQAIGFDKAILGEGAFTWKSIAALFGLLTVFAAFFSAVLLCLTSVARSFKEAQAYLIPLMLLSLAPGVASLIPGVELGSGFAVVPLLNMVLLARATVMGTATASLAAVVVGSTLAYGAAALALAARWFGSDAVLAGSSGDWGDLFRRPEKPSAQPSPTTAAAVFAVMFPAFFITGSLVGRQEELSIATRLTLNAVLTALLFGVWPLGVAIWRRIPPLAAFRLNPPALLAVSGAILAGFLAWPLMHELTLWQMRAGIGTLGAEQMERAKGILEAWKQVPFPVVLLAMAIVPAVFEELSFRGFLFSALERHLRGPATVVATAVAFGFFHLLVGGTLAVERFLPSTILGLILGTIALWSGSVLPGIFFHIAHNGTLITIAHYRDELKARGWDLPEEQHLPAIWLGASVAAIGIGLILVRISRSKFELMGQTGVAVADVAEKT